jgi:Single-strand binding protein family
MLYCWSVSDGGGGRERARQRGLGRRQIWTGPRCELSQDGQRQHHRPSDRRPELRALPSGENVCKLRLAVEGMSPGGETGHINIAAFGKPGEAAVRVLSKGWLVAVQGRLSYRAWEADDGSKRHDYEVVGNVEFLAAPRANGSGPSSERREAVAS